MRRPQLTWMCWATAASVAAAGAACQGDSLDPVEIATVEVAPPTATVTVGASVSLTATVLDAAGNVVTGRRVRWATADSNFATITDAGVVTGRYVGTVPVAASVEGKTATAQVIVVPVPVASVRISPASRDLSVGESARLTAEALDGRGVVLSGRPIADGLVVLDGDRIGGIKTNDVAVLDIDGWHTVAGGGHNERIAEADVVRRWPNLAIPIRPARRPQT